MQLMKQNITEMAFIDNISASKIEPYKIITNKSNFSWQKQIIPVRHKGPQAHLSLELQPNGTTHDPNPFVWGQALVPQGP